VDNATKTSLHGFLMDNLVDAGPMVNVNYYRHWPLSIDFESTLFA